MLKDSEILESLANPKLSSGFGLGSCQGLNFKPDKVIYFLLFFYFFILLFRVIIIPNGQALALALARP